MVETHDLGIGWIGLSRRDSSGDWPRYTIQAKIGPVGRDIQLRHRLNWFAKILLLEQ